MITYEYRQRRFQKSVMNDYLQNIDSALVKPRIETDIQS